jgi:hypothetical protein
MTTPRQIRRHARRMRRYGLQPMVIIGSGDRLPDLVIVMLTRWLWRYRSELVPLMFVTATALASSVLHAAVAHWWPALGALTALAAAIVAVTGRWLGLATGTERRVRSRCHRIGWRLPGHRDRTRPLACHPAPGPARPARRRPALVAAADRCGGEPGR